MPDLPIVKTRRLLAILEKLGFQKVSQQGSHLKLRKGEGRGVIVPLHNEVPRGTLRSILKQAGIEKEEFARLLENE
jgi:predicted RNA binding protein YcfA (HicA-like mRNA interferase family)